jgi:hypothetical protein
MMKKILALLITGVLFATANVFTDVQPVSAALANLDGKRNTFKGTVAAVNDGSLTLSLTNGDSITFVINGDTKIKMPEHDSGATVADVRIGMQAKVRAEQTEKEERGKKEVWVALDIHILKSKPEKLHRVGIVTDYAAGARIAILAKDGNPYSFLITSDTKISPLHRANRLGIGSRVVIVAVREAANAEWVVRSIAILSNAPATPTSTSTPATATNTPLPSTITNTPMPTKATNTPMPVTATNTLLPVTATNTPLPPTATNTPLPPTATNTSLPPTVTHTPLPPTATNTPLPPTTTNTPVPPTSAPVTWDGYVGPLMAAKCTTCHGTTLTLGGLSLATYQAALTGGKGGPAIVPGDPSASKLVSVQQKGNHPGQLTTDELAKVIAWIQAGAPEK